MIDAMALPIGRVVFLFIYLRIMPSGTQPLCLYLLLLVPYMLLVLINRFYITIKIRYCTSSTLFAII